MSFRGVAVFRVFVMYLRHCIAAIFVASFLCIMTNAKDQFILFKSTIHSYDITENSLTFICSVLLFWPDVENRITTSTC